MTWSGNNIIIEAPLYKHFPLVMKVCYDQVRGTPDRETPSIAHRGGRVFEGSF